MQAGKVIPNPTSAISWLPCRVRVTRFRRQRLGAYPSRSEEHTSELQSLMRISYAVFCLKKKKKKKRNIQYAQTTILHITTRNHTQRDSKPKKSHTTIQQYTQ